MIRVLVVTEYTQMNSGYAVYGRELISRLAQVPGIEVAEFAKWCHSDDEDNNVSYNTVPWRVYAAIPPKNTELRNQYEANPYAKHGSLMFNHVLLDFMPTHVLDFSDIWTSEYQARSPFRDFYAHIIMPAVDAAPQNKAWVSIYYSADRVMGYTKWGIDTIRNYGVKNAYGTASPVASPEFSRLDEESIATLKNSIGLGDIKIIGTVMRNQPRKLFWELFRDFRKFLDISGRNDIYLLCHTTSPDSFNLEELLVEHGIGGRCLFTYKCAKCSDVTVSFWNGEIKNCKVCNTYDSRLTTTTTGLQTIDLNNIYNIMDLYVQYATCLAEKTPVLTERGWIPIEKISSNTDKVLTHTNQFRKVTKVVKTETYGKMFRVSASNAPYNEVCTESHPFYVYTKKMLNITDGTTVEDFLLFNTGTLPKPEFLPLYMINPGDVIINYESKIRTRFCVVGRIEEVEYEGKYVYNLEVEKDNSFHTRIGISHNCEGFGIPLVEAIACEVPIAAVDYSAMAEIISESKGIPIKVAAKRREDSSRLMALPDGNDFIKSLMCFFSLPDEVQRNAGILSKVLYGQRNWDDNVKAWLEAIETTSPKLPWNAPERQYTEPHEWVCDEWEPRAIARFLILNVLQKPEYVNSYLEARLISDLINGYGREGFGMEGRYYFEETSIDSLMNYRPIDYYNHFVQLLRENIEWEQNRVQGISHS